LLPLKQAPNTIAVIGPNADNEDALVGNYSGMPSKPVTVLEGLRSRFPNAKVLYAPGTGLAGVAEPTVPDAHLCQDAACASPGLKVEHFADTRLGGAPTLTAVDRNARFEWQEGKRRNTSIRWSGYVKAPWSGEYKFRFMSTAGYRIWVDDKLISDESIPGDTLSYGKVTLTGGQAYPIRVDKTPSVFIAL
jgi:beta-glucosidase